jgi:hypothetical protein
MAPAVSVRSRKVRRVRDNISGARARDEAKRLKPVKEKWVEAEEKLRRMFTVVGVMAAEISPHSVDGVSSTP